MKRQRPAAKRAPKGGASGKVVALYQHAITIKSILGAAAVFPVLVSPDPDKPGKTQKTPLVKGWQNGAMQSSPAQIEALFGKHIEATHVGVRTGQGLILIDADTPEAHAYVRSHPDLFPPTHEQPTQRGTHWFYSCDPQLHINNSASKIAPGLDVRGDGGFALDWSIDKKPVDRMMARAPDTLLQLLTGPTKDHGKAKTTSANAGLIIEGGRNDFLSREAFRLRKLGMTPEAIEPVLQSLNVNACVPPLANKEIHAIAHGKRDIEPDAVPDGPQVEVVTLDDMLQRFVHITVGAFVYDRATGISVKEKEFHARYAASRMTVAGESTLVSRVWAANARRLSVMNLAFDPREPSEFPRIDGCDYLNLYREPVWPDTDAKLAAPFFEHVTWLIPDAADREAFLDWVAHAVQCPGVRPHRHFLFLARSHGTGRGWISGVFVRMWKKGALHNIDLARLFTSNHNAELSCRVMVSANEVKAPGNERYTIKERANSLFTDEFITINQKFRPVYDERLVARFFMCSNNDDALPLSRADRRVHVIRCPETVRDASYYTWLYGLHDDESFIAAVWWALKRRDISKFNPGERAPLNDAKREAIEANLSAEQQRAVEFADSFSDKFAVIGSSDLFQVVQPTKPLESSAERAKVGKAIQNALRDSGRCTYPKKERICKSNAQKIWILRDREKWLAAGEAVITTEAERAHKAIEKMRQQQPGGKFCED